MIYIILETQILSVIITEMLDDQRMVIQFEIIDEHT